MAQNVTNAPIPSPGTANATTHKEMNPNTPPMANPNVLSVAVHNATPNMFPSAIPSSVDAQTYGWQQQSLKDKNTNHFPQLSKEQNPHYSGK